MRRREFLRVVGGAAVSWPFAARAQRAIPKVGVLMAGFEGSAENAPRLAAFRKALAERGWREGQNIQIEYRWSAGKSDLIVQYSKELVAIAPDVIVANSTPVVTALSTETTSIPVVFALSMDPVGLGHVKSLSRPGGNFTGFTYVDPEMIGKWMGLLGDMVPQLTRIGLLYNPTTVGAYRTFVPQVQANHRPDNLELVAMPVRSAGEMEAAINALATRQGSGLLVGPDPFNQVNLKQIAQLTTQSRLPAVSVYRPFVMEGGLMMYGPDTADIFRRSAEYVDRILKGANPAELPVQQPSKYECIINLKTAKSLGLTVPPTLLATADEVIE
jgi:putative tryptophan/tyrosine transport system substrate-binding protein